MQRKDAIEPPSRTVGPRPLGLHVAQAEIAWRQREPHRLLDFYRGIRAYRSHPYRRQSRQRDIVWKRGGCKLLDFGPEEGWPVLAIPSLINRAYIFDLAPNASLLEFLSANGVRPFLLDWGVGIASQEPRSLEGVILERIKPALSHIHREAQRRPLVMGYCMGGTLATAITCLLSKQVAGLALLATPWDFHQTDGVMKVTASNFEVVASLASLIGDTPVDALQTLFTQIDPLAVPKKFSKFAKCSQESAAARRFVAIEDWLNDGVCLDAGITQECLQNWYVHNKPARGVWTVGGTRIRPDQLDLPVWMAIPEKDRLVPPRSSLALAHQTRYSEVVSTPGGHVGTVAGLQAGATLWPQLLRWLKRIAALQKKSW